MLEKLKGTVSIIGAGLGGTNIAIELQKNLGEMVGKISIMNVSSQDKPNLNSNQIGSIDFPEYTDEGTGKNRDTSKGLIMDAVSGETETKKQLTEMILPTTKLVLICYSVGGGFGSGVGPALVTIYKSKILPLNSILKGRERNLVVIGVPILPSMNSGTRSLLNTIYNLKETKKIVDNNLGSFFMIDNNTELQTSYTDGLNKINSNVGRLFKRYLSEYGSYQYGNLDFSDRLRSLSYSGCHAFMDLNKTDDGRLVKRSPFFIPGNTRIKNISYEIDNSMEEMTGKIENFNGLVFGDVNRGFFDKKTNENLTSIIHLAGYTNVSKLVERYEVRYDEIQNKNEDLVDNDDKTAHGFENISAKEEWISKQNQVSASIDSEQGLSALLDD